MNALTHVSSTNPNLSRLQRASFQLQQALREAAQATRECYADANISDVFLSIYITGRTHGDLKVEIKAGDLSQTTDAKAFDLQNSILEFMRRKGWDHANAPQCLTYHGETKDSDDAPL